MIRTVMACLILFAAAGCMTQAELAFDGFKSDLSAYDASVRNDQDELTVSKSSYYRQLMLIAQRDNQTAHAKLFKMMYSEALKKEAWRPNGLDELEARLKNRDRQVFDIADAYELNAQAEGQCSSFGFRPGAADFNKCVYDYKVNYLNLLAQTQDRSPQYVPQPVIQPQRPQQAMLPDPPAPAFRPQTITNCQPNGNGVTCTTN